MILITGASGQIGVDLADELVRRHGPDTVLVTDLRMPEKQRPGRIYDVLDVTYMESVEKIIQSRDISVIYHTIPHHVDEQGLIRPHITHNIP